MRNHRILLGNVVAGTPFLVPGTCTRSHLQTCTPARSHLHAHTCTLTPARSHLYGRYASQHISKQHEILEMLLKLIKLCELNGAHLCDTVAQRPQRENDILLVLLPGKYYFFERILKDTTPISRDSPFYSFFFGLRYIETQRQSWRTAPN